MKTWLCKVFLPEKNVLCEEITETFKEDISKKYGVDYEYLKSLKEKYLKEDKYIVHPYKNTFIVHSNNDKKSNDVKEEIRRHWF